MIPHIVKEQYIQIHAEDLQELIKNIYNKEIDVCKILQNGYNCIDYKVFLKKQHSIGFYEKTFNNWFENDIVENFTLYSILKDLMWKNELVEGEYLIKEDIVLKSTKSICSLFFNYLSDNNLINYLDSCLIKKNDLIRNFIDKNFDEIHLIEK